MTDGEPRLQPNARGAPVYPMRKVVVRDYLAAQPTDSDIAVAWAPRPKEHTEFRTRLGSLVTVRV
jgi:hypothetical protein